MMIAQDFSSLTDHEIDEKIEKLNKILYSTNVNLARQAYPVYLRLIEERDGRLAKKFEEHLANAGVEVNNIINIG